jgi:anti-sigma B factor antagonist
MGVVRFDRSRAGAAIVALEGEHELFTATELERRLVGFIAEGLDIVIDLSHATFVDSSVVAVLLKVRRFARSVNRRFVVVLDDDTAVPVQRMFEITGLERYLPVVHDRALALR